MFESKTSRYDLINLCSFLRGMLVSFIMIFCLLLFAQEAYAYVGNDTKVGSIRVQPGSATLSGTPEAVVTVTYVGDDNANNRVRVEWGLEGVDYSLGNNLSANHPAIPYTDTITPLDNAEIYQIRVTIEDTDGTEAAKVFNNVRPYNRILHNALTTGSGTTKWGSGWGVAGGQYGEFGCKTCHDPSSDNIKRVRKEWVDGSLPNVPARLNTVTTIFQTNVDGSAQFADDDSSSHSSSNRICESCHTITDFHRYDSSALSADHNSTKDCLGCHQHRNAFSPPGCSSCHGGGTAGTTESNFWPDANIDGPDGDASDNDSGEHVIHITKMAAADGFADLQALLDDGNSKLKQIEYCDRCHGGNAGSAAYHNDGGTYVAEVSNFKDMSNAADSMSPAGSESSGTCSNIDCHNNNNSASPGWYAGATAACDMCHTVDGTNPNEVVLDPTSGLHYSATPYGAELHDDSFDGGGGNCLSCHTTSPSITHGNGIIETPDTTTFNFQSSASIDVKVNADPADVTCASGCHSDKNPVGSNGIWYRLWSANAFDGTLFDDTTIDQALPPRCNVCHGEFINGWAEGTTHFKMEADNDGKSGGTHNSQNVNWYPGAACADCHLYPDHLSPPAGETRHENGLLTLTDDQSAPDDYTPLEDTIIEPITGRTGVYCQDCHENSLGDGNAANTFEFSQAFPGWGKVEVVPTDRNPIYTCFSGAEGCHGDTSNNWWPNIDSTDPTFWPNREGAHYEHGTTIGELLAEKANALVPGSRTDADDNGRVDAIQEDRNKTCNFCHPMTWNPLKEVWEAKYHSKPTPGTGVIETDVFGGYRFSGADKKGVYSSGDPSFGGDPWLDIDTDETTGFAYQLEENPLNPGKGTYPVDLDGEYWQYLDAYKADPSVRHGVCSNVACHSNSPFTPGWYGDHQAPGQISNLTASTDNTDVSVHDVYEYDEPGSVHLYWTATGDNGDFSGIAYEYDVYYRLVSDNVITSDNLGDLETHRAGGAATVLRQGEEQEMVVEGLTPGASYYFALVTRDRPHYENVINPEDDIYETLAAGSNLSPLSNNATAPSHLDNVAPIFWGLDKIKTHDEAGMLNLSYPSAKDHSVPISYRIWYSTYSLKAHLAGGGDVTEVAKACYMEADRINTVVEAGSDYCIDSVATESIHLQIRGLQAGDLYSFIARAYDNVGNHDDNTTVQLGMAQTAPMETVDTQLYLVNGSQQLIKQTDPAVPAWPGTDTAVAMTSAQVLVWESSYTIVRESMVSGISFDVQTTNTRRDPITLSLELGYMNGTTFTRIGALTNTDVQNSAVAIGKKSTRLQKFSLSDYKGLVPPNSRLAIRFDRWDASTSTDVTLTTGTSATKGQLLVNVRPYNHAPNGTFAINPDPPVVRPGGYIDIDWIAADPQDIGQTLHYDIYGSADNGASFPYVIATNVSNADDLNGAVAGKVTWDTVGDGLTSSHSCMVKVELGDGYLYEDPDLAANPDYPDPFEDNFAANGPTEWLTHNAFKSATISVDNTTDVEPPAAVTMHFAGPRPKQGSIFLEWTAVGDDGLNHGTRVSYYDIRYREDPDTNGALSESNWDPAVDGKTFEAEGEPVPQFSGSSEHFELLNLAPEQNYDIGVKACDEVDNCSTLAAYSIMTAKGGPFYCGICHSTPPDEPDTKGVHRQHGYTLTDCAKCHGDGTGPDDGIDPPGNNNVLTYTGRHYDGVINIGWAKNSDGTHAALAKLGIESGYPSVTITQNTDNNGDVIIYQDLLDGAGGYNMGAGRSYDDYNNTDSGTCMNFGPANANGCHGPFDPQWAPSNAIKIPPKPACADCHGSGGRDNPALIDPDAVDRSDPLYRGRDPYDRIWDCNVDGAPSELVKASPPVDNHGESGLDSKYTGAHERHLNASFRFAKGDSCRLCHLDTMTTGLHADGNVDVIFDDGANQSETLTAIYNFDGIEATTGMSCGGLSTDSCHDTFESDGVTEKPLADWPVWNEPGAQCASCHGMSTMGTIPHISDPINGGDQVCEYCHMAGHPQSPDGINPGDTLALLVNNNPAVGINYRSGGIHLRKEIGGRTTLNFNSEPIDTLAEICWGCHEDNGVSEFGPDDGLQNAIVEPYTGVGRSMYDFGSLDHSSWEDATWSSPEASFAYKTGKLQSTHSTDSSVLIPSLSWDAANGRYNEVPDPIDKIRCTNCHDVHDLNKTPGDSVSGAPYLRGTWKSNPYEEDGAPWNKDYTTPSEPALYQLGPVPRGGTTYYQKGGYFIDQNNVRPGTTTVAQYPTSGWTVASSAGLCALCHSDDVDNMDKKTGENFWLGASPKNGHSNSALGGSFVNSINVFDYSHGRPTPPATEPSIAGTSPTGIIPDMAVQARAAATIEAGGKLYIYAYRSANESGPMTPTITDNYGYNGYNWGATVDAGQTDTMYHQFSCSKCHNPHASRLPKLMITNCLDIRHNTWDDGKTTRQNSFTNAALFPVDRNMPAAYYASAQNCHRFDPARTGAERGGWNKVTPWIKSNVATPVEHKGTMDTTYGDTSPTYHKFPIENTGW